MSKLAFKESGYYEGSDDGQQPVNVANDVDSVHSTDNSCLNDVDCTDSYSLFDLEPSSVAASLSKKKNKKKRKLDISETSVDNAIAVDTRDDSNNQASEFEGTIEETVSKSAKKKRKRRKVSTGGSFETNESVDRISPDNNNKVSSFLAKFLSTKREAADVPPAPEVEEANDSFLRQFHADFASISEGGAHSSDEEADQGEDQSSVDSNVKARKLAKSLSKRNDSTTNLYASTVEDDTPKVEAVAGPTTVALQLFNLPYRISVEQLKTFGSRHGLKFATVTLGVDWKTKLPSGSATVHVELEHNPAAGSGSTRTTAESAGEEVLLEGVDGPTDEEVDECIQALQGEDCGGRPLRVQRFVAKRRQSGSLGGGRGDARYFSEDISCKCHNCGQVGHRQQECTNDALPTPCHLCAGQDHDAGGCPNITCYRCGKFGHHSRDCTNASMAKPVICTNCGSPTHDLRTCRDATVHYKPGLIAVAGSRVAGPKVRCMACNEYGHVMCQQLPPIPAASADDVYCPNCGENGHHIDFPLLCRVSSIPGAKGSSGSGEGTKKKQRSQSLGSGRHPEPGMCMEPKYDAFVRYPQLLRELDDIPLAERLGYYKELTRRGTHGDQMLFPPLARQQQQHLQQQHSGNNGANQGNFRNGNANQNGRRGIGGGSGGGGDSRSVSIKLQDNDRGGSYSSRGGGDNSGGGSASKSRGPSALERITGRDSYQRGDASYPYTDLFGSSHGQKSSSSHNNNSSSSGRKRERDNDRDWEDGRDRGYHNDNQRRQSGAPTAPSVPSSSHKRRRDASPSPPPPASNSRRHSFPLSKSNPNPNSNNLNNSNNHSSSSNGNATQKLFQPDAQRVPPSHSKFDRANQQQSDPAWIEKYEARKRRFNVQ